ncbi:pectin lyase-like protein [Violaceomyces palustris]|uniref:Pectin lyase-like protein n=1 Tax=Violaceomyces palustris TaxID=1673888 RepID=A0ACD0P5U0_9BASI|nr:pectin lyase-like protein [Violaceomyces palustris]
MEEEEEGMRMGRRMNFPTGFVEVEGGEAEGRLSRYVIGSPVGFAKGTLGGGDLPPVRPKTVQELIHYLTQEEPRVILLEGIYDFTGTEGGCRDCKGCVPDSYTCGSQGQLAIDKEGMDWCEGKSPIKVSYDKAGVHGLIVKDRKTIVGLGRGATIRGKGLRFYKSKDVILQNVHLTEINPSLIFGGDALSLEGSERIWIDHVKVSRIGRQFLVTQEDPSRAVTISNCDFDGRTTTSATCDGLHYWTILGYGKGDQVTFTANHIHHTSGRSPRLQGSGLVWHVVGNYFSENSGHAFDLGPDVNVLIEGNIFDKVKETLLSGGGASSTTSTYNGFVVNRKNSRECKQRMGRDCEFNAFADSPVFRGTDFKVLSLLPPSKTAPRRTLESVRNTPLTAGCGDLLSTSPSGAGFDEAQAQVDGSHRDGGGGLVISKISNGEQMFVGDLLSQNQLLSALSNEGGGGEVKPSSSRSKSGSTGIDS